MKPKIAVVYERVGFMVGSTLEALRAPKTRSIRQYWIFSILLLLSVAIVYRYQLANGFSILSGDRYDVVISTSILEHWFNCFLGRANWAEVNYFYPYTRTIAQTDAFFLLGVAYIPFRLLGLDQFLSAELAGMVVKALGFVGAYLLSRRVFTFSFGSALVVAILFTLSNGMTSHGSRLQLATVAFAPFMAILLWSAYRALIENNPGRFRKTGSAAGVLYGAWCLTCFYMAWFFAFFMTVFAAAALMYGRGANWAIFKNGVVSNKKSIAIVVIVWLVALIPFIYAFLPKTSEVGVRTYEEVLSYTVPLEGVLQVGYGNHLFGELYNRLLSYIAPRYSPAGDYYNTGFSVFLFVLFAGGCISVMRQHPSADSGITIKALVAATLLTWATTLNVSGHSGWYFIYHAFPGAKALRVVSTYQIFLALPVIIVAVRYLSKQRIAKPLGLLILVLLIAGELNRPYINLDRQAELHRISVPHSPPKDCQVFFASGWSGQESISGFPPHINGLYAHNVSAIMIAQIAGIPTINGMASFNPPDWNFGDPGKRDYDDRIFSYAKKHEITGLCKLNLNNKQWAVLPGFTVMNSAANGS